eukprot:gene51291-67333_t
MVYSRDGEEPIHWPVAALGSMAMATQGEEGKPAALYPMTDFRLYRRRPLLFPDALMATRNFFDLRWGGERRLKNVICCVEWVPDAAELRVRGATSRDYAEADAGVAGASVAEVCALLRDGAADGGAVGEGALRDLLRIALRRDVSADDLCRELRPTAGAAVPDIEDDDDTGGAGADHAAVAAALAGNALRHRPPPYMQDGRYFAAVALCEAEALRTTIYLHTSV